jgi:hypothetical protein
VAERNGRYFIGLSVMIIAACGSSGDDAPGKQPPITECTTRDQCPTGTVACIDGFCVSAGCTDNDNDGAGIGPGCVQFDCDDGDPDVPGVEVCNFKDDNCDGIVDEGCPCKDEEGNTLPDGATRTCGGTATECQGVQRCVAGKWANACEGGKAPQPSEVCGNDIDENCNGELDEGCCPPNEAPCPGVAVCSSNGVCN